MGELTATNSGMLARLGRGVVFAWGWLLCKLSYHSLERPKSWNRDRQYPYRLCRCTRCHGKDWRYNLDPALRVSVDDDTDVD
ncbi:hypothetical protein [Rhizobium sp. BK176]|uniref:hypothetical protein n=1 Tax=Rhizobium sp. BK176 TaxID=2587071 RepID=UPI00216AA647|nr:hypothetical protein [Rhizobium sp. BK176]MCS4088502.1 hypothetical protein [Rhizobium sp. BK176]